MSYNINNKIIKNEIKQISEETFLYLLDYYFKYKTIKNSYKLYNISELIKQFYNKLIDIDLINNNLIDHINNTIDEFSKITKIKSYKIKNIILNQIYD